MQNNSLDFNQYQSIYGTFNNLLALAKTGSPLIPNILCYLLQPSQGLFTQPCIATAPSIMLFQRGLGIAAHERVLQRNHGRVGRRPRPPRRAEAGMVATEIFEEMASCILNHSRERSLNLIFYKINDHSKVPKSSFLSLFPISIVWSPTATTPSSSSGAGSPATAWSSTTSPPISGRPSQRPSPTATRKCSD